MEYALSPADLATFSAHEVASLADVDRFAVRDEGFRRQAKAEKRLAAAERKLAKAQAEMDAAKAEMALSATIIEAALLEERREADARDAERAEVSALFSEACHGAGPAPRWAARDALDALAKANGRDGAFCLLQAHGFDLAIWDAARPASR